MFKRLYGHLEYQNIPYPLQFGFKQKCSTSHALIQITESVCNSVGNNGFGCGIFNYLKKAFDHSIFLSKLNHYGVRCKAYDWFQSYLSNTEQFVCINGHNSDSLSMNDLPNTSKLCSFQLFADDTKIYCSSNDLILN